MLCLELMQWKYYELIVHGKTWVGEEWKVLRLQYKETILKCLLDYLKPKLSTFILHNYVARFQEEQYKICLQTFLKTFIMSIVDFAENYTFHFYNEIHKRCIGIHFK